MSNGKGEYIWDLNFLYLVAASIMFTMGVALKAYPNPDDAISAVQSMGVKAICAEGRKQIDRLVERANLYHGLLMGNLLQTKNVFYSATIVDGINGFFMLYDADFAAMMNDMKIYC